ncbi:MAG: DUF3256 family protein [Bacteroidales bacterium]
MTKLTLCLIVLFSTLGVRAQNIKPFFTISTESTLSYLNVNQRKDLIDLYEAGKSAIVQNSLRGKTELKELSESYLKLQLSSQTIIELKLLPVDELSTPLILMLNTQMAGLKESSMKLYSTDWALLSLEDYIEIPSRYDFMYTPSDLELRSELDGYLDLFLLNISFDPLSLSLILRPSFNEPIDDKTAIRLKELLSSNPIIYRWGGKRFERV